MAIVLVRTLVIYFALLITMRLLGKRQLGEMELSEFVLAALIADLAAHPLQDIGIPLINGLVPILTLFCCEVLISGATLKSVRLRSLFFGRPSVLILRGKVIQRELRKNRFSLDELMQELRNQGVLDISKIEYGILETDGRLNVLIEFLLHITFGIEGMFVWSIYPLTVCVLLGVMLLVVAVCKPLRRSLHRKFFL